MTPEGIDYGSPGDESGSSFLGGGVPSGVSSAARIAAAAWMAAMQQKRQPCVMKPWDENTYCLAPKVTRFVLAQNVDTLIAESNPQRVAIIFSEPEGIAGQLAIAPNQAIDPANIAGIGMPKQNEPVFITQKDLLNLASVEWHALTTAASAILCVIEVVLRDWSR